MKKIVSFLFLLGIVISLSGCCPCCKDCAKKGDSQESTSEKEQAEDSSENHD